MYGLGVVSLKALEELHASGNQPEKPTAASKERVLAAAGTLHHRADDARQQTFGAPDARVTA